MSNLGMGVMLGMLGGNRESVEVFNAAVGKTIADVVLMGDALRFTFTDGTRMALLDDGQSCCESRYMVCEDDLSYHVGATLLSAEVRHADNASDDDYGVHEVAFLQVTTSKGVIVAATHNEHNGYYGGFWIVAKAVEAN